jgi:hypothetical protein
MKKCTYCGRINEDHTVNCGGCGQQDFQPYTDGDRRVDEATSLPLSKPGPQTDSVVKKINMMHVLEKVDTSSKTTWRYTTFFFEAEPKSESSEPFIVGVKCPTCGERLEIKLTQGVFRISRNQLRRRWKLLTIILGECFSGDSFSFLFMGGIFLGVLPAGIMLKIGVPGELAAALSLALFGSVWLYCIRSSIQTGIRKKCEMAGCWWRFQKVARPASRSRHTRKRSFC